MPAESLHLRPPPAASSLAVELWAARLPLIGWLAWHHWFVIRRDHRVDRWEIWQRVGAGGVWWGHLHCNLLEPECGVGGGASKLVQRWQGREAVALAARVETSPMTYPYVSRYRYWPGPNSNTYAQWVLGHAFPLPWRAHGRRFAARPAFPSFRVLLPRPGSRPAERRGGPGKSTSNGLIRSGIGRYYQLVRSRSVELNSRLGWHGRPVGVGPVFVFSMS